MVKQRSAWVVLVAWGAMACNNDDSKNPDEDDVVSSPTLVLEAEDGTIVEDDAAAYPGIVWVANIDDDDQDGTADWDNWGPSGDDDYTQLTIPASAFGEDDSVQLELTGDLSDIRIWYNTTVFLGANGVSTGTVQSGGADQTLYLEFGAAAAQGLLTITGADSQIATRLTSSPMLMAHHLQPTEVVWSMPMEAFSESNAEMMDAYRTVLGDRFVEVEARSYQYDVWVQDEFEMATTTAPDKRLDIVWNLLRDRSRLDNMPGDMIAAPGTAEQVWGTGRGTSQDYGGNIEVSPPVTVDGVEYPFGRVYYGAQGRYKPNDTWVEMVEAQGVQAPFAIDSSWLCVGHVDEWVTTIPDPTAPQGFRLVYSDVDLGYELLESMDPATELPKFAPHYDFSTVKEIAEDGSLRAYNEDLRDNYLEPILAVMMQELGLTEEEVIRYPQLFEEPWGCGGTAAALWPGMANMVIADDEQGQAHAFIPDPFMRANLEDQSQDPFIGFMEESLPADLGLHFVDDFEVYHIYLGEVHCGTNVQRTPIDDWWDTAPSLLEDRL